MRRFISHSTFQLASLSTIRYRATHLRVLLKFVAAEGGGVAQLCAVSLSLHGGLELVLGLVKLSLFEEYAGAIHLHVGISLILSGLQFFRRGTDVLASVLDRGAQFVELKLGTNITLYNYMGFCSPSNWDSWVPNIMYVNNVEIL